MIAQEHLSMRQYVFSPRLSRYSRGICAFKIACGCRGALARQGQSLAVWSGVGFGLSGTALAEAIAVAVHLENTDVVGQPVKQRTGQPFGTEG